MLPVLIIVGAAITSKTAIGAVVGVVGSVGVVVGIYRACDASSSDKVIIINTNDISVAHYSILLRDIGRRYPVAQMVNTEDETIVLFCQDSTTQEQRLSRLQDMFHDFSIKKKSFEATLTQLAAEEVESKIPSINGSQITFHQNQIFRKDRCDSTLKDKASTLYGCLLIAYQKQEVSENDNCLMALESMINQFNRSLESLSDNVSQYAIYSSAFSLARHIESLRRNYSKINKNLGFFRCLIQPERAIALEEIDFLKTISRHEHCDDVLRYAALKVLEQKSGSQTYNDPELKKVLNKGLSHTHHHVNQSLCFKMLRDFCHENSIILSDDLQLYLNSFMRERGKPMC